MTIKILNSQIKKRRRTRLKKFRKSSGKNKGKLSSGRIFKNNTKNPINKKQVEEKE